MFFFVVVVFKDEPEHHLVWFSVTVDFQLNERFHSKKAKDSRRREQAGRMG